MKKFLLIATALAGFASVAQAQEATTVKTTTVQYPVSTCTNCRTTTQVRTVYPEQKPTCSTCAQAAMVPVMRERKGCPNCKSNHEYGIRNPLFVLKEGQFSLQEVGSLYKEPKRKDKPQSKYYGEKIEKGEWRGYDAHMRVAYGITDRWSVQALGGKQYHIPKTDQWRAAARAESEALGIDPPITGPIPHESSYDVTVGTYYHVLDLCHLDVIVGLEGTWHRHKVKTGDNIKRINGWSWDPTVTIGSTWGWFTPYLIANYTWDHTKADKKNGKGEVVGKTWKREHGYFVQPGLYIQPSKWYAFDFSWQKLENAHIKPQWNAGIDFYPYKNITFGLQFNARRPYADPMDMFGASADFKVVF